jgi:hypothetical protein
MLERDGYIGLKDFRGDTIRAFIERLDLSRRSLHRQRPAGAGDPDEGQGAAVRPDAEGLARGRGPALADYILVFRKPGENAVPIQPDITNEQWIEWARPIWYGIRESDTLHVAKRAATTTSATSARCSSGPSSAASACGATPANWCCRRSPASGRKATRRCDSAGGSSGSS